MMRNWLLATALALGIGSTSAADVQAGPTPVLAQIKVTSANAKSYIVESLVTVALVGGALFVICRTSRR
ncbi:MAG: hypothetical protein JSS02_13980 [Planctomycetes bacterium]|nr:hypothetical protein [Planctomycetota bacterium]